MSEKKGLFGGLYNSNSNLKKSDRNSSYNVLFGGDQSQQPQQPYSTPVSPSVTSSNIETSIPRSISSPNLRHSLDGSEPRQNLGHGRGVSLNMNAHQPIDPYSLVHKTVRFLLARGLSLENLFNPKGEQYDPIEIERVKRLLIKEGEAAQLTTVTKDAFAVAVILKELLKAKEPLISFDMYDSLILCDSIVAAESKLQYLQQLILSLDKIHYEALRQLLTLFHLMLENKELNRIDADSISSCFGSLLLRPREQLYYMEGDEESVRSIIKLIVDNYATFVKSDGRD